MIARRTLHLFLLAVLLGLGLTAWSLSHRDVCSAHLAGLPGPATQVVVEGRAAVEVPCEQWFPRQPLAAQGLYLLTAILGVMILVSFTIDLVRWRRTVRPDDPLARS